MAAGKRGREWRFRPAGRDPEGRPLIWDAASEARCVFRLPRRPESERV